MHAQYFRIRGSPLAATAMALCLCSWALPASGDLFSQTPVELTIELGSRDNALRFFPDNITLESGRLYRLTLNNSSPVPHYFSSPEFVRNIFTHKVLVLDNEGQRVGEVKGIVQDLEVYPGGTIEWWLVPLRSLAMGKFKCSIAGHAEKGMVGTVAIE